MNEQVAFFLKRKENFETLAKKTADAVSRLSIFRISVFVVALSLIVYFANERQAWSIAVSAVFFLLIFGVLISLHNRALRKYAYLSALSDTNNDEVLRLKNELSELKEGSQFNTAHHPYTADLDIFGRYSIFQLLNRTTTPQGQERLASWLKYPSKRDILQKKQEAVKELVDELDWRQSFEATGRMNVSKKSDDFSLLHYLVQPAPVSSGFKMWASFSILGSLAIYILVFVSLLSWHWAGFALIINSVFLIALARFMSTDYKRLTGIARRLSVYVDLFDIIEKSNFSSEILNEQKQALLSGPQTASEAFRSLGATLNRFDNRSNMLYQLLNAVALLDYWLVLRAHSWFRKNGDRITGWLNANAELEAFSSLAGFAYANPSYVFPTLERSGLLFQAKSIGHPLLASDERVTNDFSVSGRGLFLITGSNMSGKSTFLRTVGVNIVLALAGAPVCASQMTVSHMQVFTSMRTQDALEENVSSFYAELQRIRQLLDLLETGEPVLYMLDEVLKGTNSDDRHKGTEALVYQLLRKNATGFISTHDLSLSHLGDDVQEVSNYSFNNFIEGDKLIFDYKLKEGPCRSFNASQLMKNMGIEINS